MNQRALGRSGLQVSPLCFGGNVFGLYSRWAPGHSGGESETIIGKWLQRSGKRDKVVLATKVGKDMGDGKVGLAPAYIRSAVEASLQRLQTDVIDLYQSHDDDPKTPLADTLGAYADLIKAGKVRAIGASNFTAARLSEALAVSEAHGLPRYECLQPLYNLVERPAYEAELEAVCVANGLGVINFFALASGFLSGKYRSLSDLGKSTRGEGAKKYLNPHGLGVLAALDSVAARLNSTPAQVALAWQIARPSVTAPIASATSLDQLKGLVAAAALKLDADAMRSIDLASITP
jgi:aryl-alcohol dehydrogenase-like predicted oxidoreductase